ncbi:MAG: hypothetical protein WDM88_03205 [Galbitalea sp.]
MATPHLKTTEQAFGEKLHTYTIVDAISDKNVLPFRIDYVNTIKLPEGITDKQVSAIDTEKALLDPERIRQVVAYTLEHFDQKTRRASFYAHTRVANVEAVAGGRNQISEVKALGRVAGSIRSLRRPPSMRPSAITTRSTRRSRIFQLLSD